MQGEEGAVGCSAGLGHIGCMNPTAIWGEAMEAQKKIIDFCLD